MELLDALAKRQHSFSGRTIATIPFLRNHALFSVHLLNASKMNDQPVSDMIASFESELSKSNTLLSQIKSQSSCL